MSSLAASWNHKLSPHSDSLMNILSVKLQSLSVIETRSSPKRRRPHTLFCVLGLRRLVLLFAVVAVATWGNNVGLERMTNWNLINFVTFLIFGAPRSVKFQTRFTSSTKIASLIFKWHHVSLYSGKKPFRDNKIRIADCKIIDPQKGAEDSNLTIVCLSQEAAEKIELPKNAVGDMKIDAIIHCVRIENLLSQLIHQLVICRR